MKAKQLKKLSKDKLMEKLEEAKKALIDLKFEIKIGETKDYGNVKKKRKDVARIITVLNEGVEGKVEPVKKEAKVVKSSVKKENKDAPKKATKDTPKATKENK